MKEVTEIVKCPITDDSEHITYFDLGEFPLVNNLCDTKQESIDCKRVPLRVNLFTKSNLSVLSHSVNSELMFSNYLFKSEVNVPYIKHCERMFDYISGLTKLNKNDSIVDIGGNDGTLLQAFKKMSNIKLNYLNIDPSKNLAKLSEEKGIPVLNDYFSLETAKNIDYKVKIVTSTNVFQHLRDTNSFADGVYHLLEDDGLWLLEFPYWIHDLETKSI